MFPIDHIGIAVENLDDSIDFYREAFGLELDLREKVDSQKVEIAFLDCGNTLIELLTPTSPDSALAKFIASKGPGIHHICFRVNDIHAQLKRYEADGYQLIDREPRPGAHGSRIAFIHPKSMGGVLIELCERPA